MVPEKIKAELKKFLTARQVEEITKHLDGYEKRVREAVKKFDLKGREARLKGQQRLEKFTSQVRRTGKELEKQFKVLMKDEGKILNKGLNDLFSYFKAAKKTQKKSKSTKKKSSPRKSRAKRVIREQSGSGPSAV